MIGRTGAESRKGVHGPFTQHGEKEWTQPRQRLQQQSAEAFMGHVAQQNIDSRPQPGCSRTAPAGSEGTQATSASTTALKAATANTSYTVFPPAAVVQRPPYPSAATTAQDTVVERQPFPGPVTSFRGVIIPTIIVSPDKDSVPQPAGAVASGPTAVTHVAGLQVAVPKASRMKLQTSSQESCNRTGMVITDEFEGEVAAESTAGGCVGSVARDVIHLFLSGGGAAAACASDALDTPTGRPGCDDPMAAAEGCQNGVHRFSSSLSDNNGVNPHDAHVKGDLSVCGSGLNSWCASSLICNTSSTDVSDQEKSNSCSSSDRAARSSSPLEQSPTGGDAAGQGDGSLPCSRRSKARDSTLVGYVRGCATHVCATLSSCYPAGEFSSRVTSESDTQPSGKELEWNSSQDSNTSISTDLISNSTAFATQVSTIAEIATQPADAPVTAGADRSRKKGSFCTSVQNHIWYSLPMFSYCSELVAARRSSRTSENVRPVPPADGKAEKTRSRSCGFATCEEELFNRDNGSTTNDGSCCIMTKKALLCCRAATSKGVATVLAGAAWVKNGNKHILPAVTAVSQLGGCYTESHHIGGDIYGEAPERKSCPVCDGLDFADVPLLS